MTGSEGWSGGGRGTAIRGWSRAGVVGLLLGLVVAVAMGLYAYKALKVRTIGIHATGTSLRTRHTSVATGNTVLDIYKTTVRFSDRIGREHVVEVTGDYKPGSVVGLVYLPTDTDVVWTDRSTDVATLAFVIVVCLIGLAVGVVGLRTRGRYWHDRPPSSSPNSAEA